MKRLSCVSILLLGFASSVSSALAGAAESPGSRHTTGLLPGQQPDGSVLLPNQWSLRPVGRQVPLGDFPVNIAVHPGGRYAAVLHSGYGKQLIAVVDIQAARVVTNLPVREAFYGLEFSRNGKELFCSGAGDEILHRFTFRNGVVAEGKEIRLHPAKQREVPAGMALSRDGSHLYAANIWGHRITSVELRPKIRVSDIPLTAVVLTNLVEAKPSADFDTAASTKRFDALSDPTISTDPFPYACRLDEKRGRLYVSLWAQSSVAVIDLRDNAVLARWPTGQHPNEMLLTRSGKWLYVANANHNSVTVIDTATGCTLETLSAALYPVPLPGSTPNSLALTPDEETLFIANADNNNVAVFDVSKPGRSRSLGFIPVGWYPTSVRVTPDGRYLLVANGKGLVSKANPKGEYIGGLFRGTLSVLDLPRRTGLESLIRQYTVQAIRCTPLHADASVTTQPATANPIPSRVGQPSPIKYCLYIVKENRTYDQVLGDLPEGNGDPKICLFPEKVTPNHHQLARDFVLLDNFYVNGEVSADGHEWTMGAYATDFVEKFWPMSYGHNSKHSKYPYPSEGNFRIAFSPSGYLWDRAKEAGVSYRSYGEFVANGKTAKDPAVSRVATLQGHFDEWYHGWDLDYPDAKRADRFIEQLKEFEAKGDMPRLQVIRLPNDHTSGTAVGKLTPRAMVADNDLALGRVVEAVSQSKFWPQTAIFVIEDDAQNGPDHVDAHRSIAFVISPYTRKRGVDSTMYTTSSMLRTIELILGLKPMSQYDAAATPMYNSFLAQADARPYTVVPVEVDRNERNRKTAWGSKLSGQMDFSKEDAADDFLLNEVIWRSIRGGDHPMPAPIRAAFFLAHPQDRDD